MSERHFQICLRVQGPAVRYLFYTPACYSICLRMSGRLIIQTSCRKENCTFWSPSLDLGAIVFQIGFLIFGIILWAGYANAVAETKSVFSAAKNVSLQY